MTGNGRRTARSRVKSSTDDGEDRTVRNIKPSTRLRKDKGRDHSFIRILDVNLKALLGFGILTFLIALFFINHLVKFPAGDDPMLRVITPFPAPKLVDLPMFQGEHKESLYWGTYRPHVYLGIRARVPQSLIAGMMWIGVKDGRYFIRHVCQDSDELKTYGWTNHNGRDFGQQVLVDQDMSLATSFFKFKGEDSGYGGDWVVTYPSVPSFPCHVTDAEKRYTSLAATFLGLLYVSSSICFKHYLCWRNLMVYPYHLYYYALKLQC